MTIVVLGHLVLDEIHRLDGSVVRSLGGIYFPLAAFGALARPDDTVLPVLPVGADAWEPFREAMQRFPRVRLDGCVPVDEPNTRVRLFHDAAAGYNTQLVRSLGPIPRNWYASVAANADLVYVNMMTGRDVFPGDAASLRGAARGRVYLDLHMIAYRVESDGRRFHAPIGDAAQWLAVPDVLQCNARELAALAAGEDDERRAVAALRDAGCAALLAVTKGEAGASVYPPDGAAVDIAAVPVAGATDTTGCGDVFGATFAHGLTRGMPLRAAGERAVRAAAFVAGIPGSIGIERLGDAMGEPR